ncbi:MAG: DUF4872 domain-containing protein [Anaerolineae bacterium]|nr:DUF4872 domain-containing protein [Anaerolineae bacterium]
MPVLANYHEFDGVPWATGYLKNALAYQGAQAPHTNQPYTEALLMGINGGICAGYFSFEYEGYPPHLHFLTRYLFTEEPGAVFERLAIPMQVQQTPNPQKAAANVVNALAEGKPAIVWADGARLPYNNYPTSDDFWNVMPLVVYGYEVGGSVQIADRACVSLTASEEDMIAARARIAKSRNRMMTIGSPNPNHLPDAVRAGIQSCIDLFSGKSPVGSNGNFGLNAYQKWIKLLEGKGKESWAVRFAPRARMYAGLTSTYKYLEVYFTGGHGARHIYADFLEEAAIILEKPALQDTAPLFRASALAWDALTAALLPDDILLLRETRELMVRDYQLFLEQGGASLDERHKISARLTELEAEAAEHFPLNEAQAADFRAALRTPLQHLHDAEKVAIAALVEAMA